MITKLDNAIKRHRFKPKGVKVSHELFSALSKADRIEMKRTHIWGVIDMGFDLPFINGDTYLIADMSLNDDEFELPEVDVE
ncbi:MAG: hypothetical protein JKY60_20460 [Kordiimonadaceae bacterium]|nr:hypothetical protein [Kordiimonadaceae bacterium]